MSGPESSEPGFTFVDRRRRGDEAGDAPAPVIVPPPEAVPPPAPEPLGGPADRPQADLTSLCVMLYTDAMVHLGQAPGPGTSRPRVDLEQARFAIDLLAMLHEKTRNNRTPNETSVLEEMLATLRMGFVQLSRRK